MAPAPRMLTRRLTNRLRSMSYQAKGLAFANEYHGRHGESYRRTTKAQTDQASRPDQRSDHARRSRKDCHLMTTENDTETVTAFCQRTLVGIKAKADHNKSEALWCIIITMFWHLTSPLFVTLGEGLHSREDCAIGPIAGGGSGHRLASTAFALSNFGDCARTAQRELENSKPNTDTALSITRTRRTPTNYLPNGSPLSRPESAPTVDPLIPNPETLKTLEADRAAKRPDSLPPPTANG